MSHRFPPAPFSFTHALPSSFALAGFPVYLADSRSAPFSLGGTRMDTRETKHETGHILLISSHRMCRNTWERHERGNECTRGHRSLSNQAGAFDRAVWGGRWA